MRLYNYLTENIDYKIYCDMDGVIVDFITGANKIAKAHKFSRKWEELANRNANLAWDIINEKGSDFWARLGWEKNGKKLWSYIEKYNPVILSAYPYNIENPDVKNNAIIGKKAWIEKHIGNEASAQAIICARKEKILFAEENAILIDDMEKNIKEWKQAGGIGILHKSYRSTIKRLQELL